MFSTFHGERGFRPSFAHAIHFISRATKGYVDGGIGRAVLDFIADQACSRRLRYKLLRPVSGCVLAIG